MNNTKKLKELQAERMKKYPPDRICFYSSDSSAAMDQTTFIAYEAGQLSMAQAMAAIAKHNFLEFITVDQFRNAVRDLGYDRNYIVRKEKEFLEKQQIEMERRKG
jgi:hypothetical protein